MTCVFNEWLLAVICVAVTQMYIYTLKNFPIIETHTNLIYKHKPILVFKNNGGRGGDITLT